MLGSISEARRCSADDFLSLIREVSHLLALEREDGAQGDQAITGGLVTLPKSGEAIVVSDLHGDFESLVAILEGSGFVERAKQDEPLYLVSLGDYGDRGPESLEVYYAFLRLKRDFPGKVVLLRGNHEGPQEVSVSPYDLLDQIMQKFPDQWEEAHTALRSLMPLFHQAVLVEGSYLLLHGGIPIRFKSIDEIARAHETHPNTSHLEEVLWNDPFEGNGYWPSPRGAGMLFGEDVTARALESAKVRTLIRGHEPCADGVRVNHGGKVLTIFSRKGPPYFNLKGAYLRLKLSEAKDAYALANEAKVI